MKMSEPTYEALNNAIKSIESLIGNSANIYGAVINHGKTGDAFTDEEWHEVIIRSDIEKIIKQLRGHSL
jgi:hypothetical protein